MNGEGGKPPASIHMDMEATPEHPLVVDVGTGEIAEGGPAKVLMARALGSCIAIAVYFPEGSYGILAHVMLPGRAPDRNKESRALHSADAVDGILKRLSMRGIPPGKVVVCLAGGGNVLQREDDLICSGNIASVSSLLADRGLTVRAKALGGFIRRSCALYPGLGEVWVSEAGGKEFLLWSAGG